MEKKEYDEDGELIETSPPETNDVESTGEEDQVEGSTPPVEVNDTAEYKYERITKVHYEGLALAGNATGLTPFTNYSFIVTACTVAGCTDSIPRLPK